jgi:hypothetical protein
VVKTDKICNVKGCGKKCHGRGLCGYHYDRELDRRAKRDTYRRNYLQRPAVKARRREYSLEYKKRPEVRAKLNAYKRAYSKRPENKRRLAEYLRVYNKQPEVKQRKKDRRDFLEKEREYQKLLCLYEERNGRIPLLMIRRLEALSEYFGRDLEEWRVGVDKERHAKEMEANG